MNPILPLHYAAPDGEAHVHPSDPNTLYLYASNDRIGGGGMDPWQHVWSSQDLIRWTEHKPGFQAKVAVDFCEISGMPAIDAIEKDGKYYYYFTAGGRQCVAFSDRPEGPFLNAKPIYGTEFPSCGDPAIFVDDDGCAYLYWGQFSLRGCKLKDNMYELEEDTIQTMLITEDEHGFHEGSSMRKREDWYYLVYADTDRGAATCLSYAKSRSPLGPFQKGGVIIDNIDCDLAAWNNHGSIVCFHGQWYVMYHRACHGMEMGGRKACMEPIYFDKNGDIAEVKMTTQGIEGPIPATERMDAWRVCAYSRPAADSRIGRDADALAANAFFWRTPVTGWRQTMLNNMARTSRDLGLRTEHIIKEGQHFEYLTKWKPGEGAIYRYLDFGKGLHRFTCSAASYLAITELEIHIDGPDGPIIGVCTIDDTGGWGDWNWQEFCCEIKPITGVHEVVLVARNGGMGSRLCDLNWFQFA